MDINEQALLDIVAEAGEAILEVYKRDFEVQNKADDSPLTEADLAAHEIIVKGLTALTPEIPIISEESEPPPYSERSQWTRYWLVDPLDGTKEFVNRNGEFTVNIALIEAGVPVYGVVGVPVQDRIFVGDVAVGESKIVADGQSTLIRGRRMFTPPGELLVVASRSHGGDRLEAYLGGLEEKMGTLQKKAVGSSLKLCVLAAGEADCYPRLGPTSEWDIGAAHAVLRAAGGEVYTLEGHVLPYNSEDSLLNPDFMAVADAAFDWRSLM